MAQSSKSCFEKCVPQIKNDKSVNKEMRKQAMPFFKCLVCTIIILPAIHISAVVLKRTQYEQLDYMDAAMPDRYFRLVSAEWEKPMITGLYLTHGECEEAAFERTWHGTQEYTYEEFSKRGGSKRNRKRKKTADAVDPITVSTIRDGVSICV